MKTAEQVQIQIKRLLQAAGHNISKNERLKLAKELNTLHTVLSYLQSDPRPEFLHKQFAYVEKKIVNYKLERLKLEGLLPDIKKPAIKALNQEFEISKLRKQRMALAYLLGQEATIS